MSMECKFQFFQEFTTFNNCHNHILLPDIKDYSTKYRCISENVLKEIRFLTENGNLLIIIQPYKKSVYGNDTFCIRFVYVFTKFRITIPYIL